MEIDDALAEPAGAEAAACQSPGAIAPGVGGWRADARRRAGCGVGVGLSWVRDGSPPGAPAFDRWSAW